MAAGFFPARVWGAFAAAGVSRRPLLPAYSVAGLQGLFLSSPPHSNSVSPSFRGSRSFASLSSSSSFSGRRILPPSSRDFWLVFSSVLISEVRTQEPGLRISMVGASPAFSSATSAGSPVATTPEDVLRFWFRDIDPEKGVYKSTAWFKLDPEFDKECMENFGGSLKLAIAGELNGWMESAQGRLALVILLDQISRNLYRDSPSSYSQDERACQITLDTIKQGWDKNLTPWERWILYMPLMHSEKILDHEVADLAFKELADEHINNGQLHEDLVLALGFQRKHTVVIKKFGRYPSRNAVLGRTSTKEEEEFLASGNAW